MPLFPLVAILLVLSLSPAQAALPPLDDTQRVVLASHIVEGQVTAIDRREALDRIGTRTIHTLTLQVFRVLKGEGIAAGKTVQTEFWRAARRPEGWVGDGGQRGGFVVGARLRFYLAGGEGHYRLLNPNGSETLDRPPPFQTLKVGDLTVFYPADWSADDPKSSGAIDLWPPESSTPGMSFIAVEPLGPCGDLDARRVALLAEIATYLNSELIAERALRRGEGFELQYRWIDAPGQTPSFHNWERYGCRSGRLYRVRLNSVDGEFERLRGVAWAVMEGL